MALSLAEVVRRQPYPDFQDWWPLGEDFLAFMSQAIVAEWQGIRPRGDADRVDGFAQEYTRLVYGRESRAPLVDDFLAARHLDSFQSGEFDALSYAFYRDAFETLAVSQESESPEQARRAFTRRVGRRFFQQMAHRLSLALPSRLADAGDFAQLQGAIQQVGGFLVGEGYLRDHFAFRFDVTARRGAQTIAQAEAGFLSALSAGLAYALYEMGYPIILPSAVYLYQTLGEAQHHSSRTIEELFARCGCAASETADFDPTSYPSQLVVELWEIRPKG